MYHDFSSVGEDVLMADALLEPVEPGVGVRDEDEVGVAAAQPPLGHVREQRAHGIKT